MTSYPDSITITEVGPRDGLQIEPRILSLDEKLTLIASLADSGLRSIEVTGFVHPKVVPQFADALELARALPRRPGVRYGAFIPNLRGAERAIEGGIDDIKCGVATSDTFNALNVRMTTEEGMAVISQIASATSQSNSSRLVGAVATAFGCPYEGPVTFGRVARLFEHLAEHGAKLIFLADTTGVADPALVERTVAGLQRRFPEVEVGLHLHNTRGLGIANALSGMACGVREFESSIGGLGGCPFAPRAVGNICTEDFAHMLDRMGIGTGLDLGALISAANLAQDMLGRPLPGMVMKAGPADELHDPGAKRVKLD